MAEHHKIDPSTAQKEGTSPNYDNEIKRLTALWLSAELTDRSEKVSHETSKLALEERKWKLTVAKWKLAVGKWIVFVAAVLPLIFFGVLAWQISDECSAFNRLGDIPQAILISASILSFVAIYVVLIKGMFQHAKNDDDDSHSTSEMMNIMRRFLPKSE